MTNEDLQQHINDEVKETLRIHSEHLAVANSEMGIIKTDLAVVVEKMSAFEEKLEAVDTRLWFTLSAVLLGIAAQILIAVTKTAS